MFPKNGDGTQKISLSESKIELWILTIKISHKIASKPKYTHINVFVSEPAFWRYFWIKKISSYAQVMAKILQVDQKGPWRGRMVLM